MRSDSFYLILLTAFALLLLIIVSSSWINKQKERNKSIGARIRNLSIEINKFRQVLDDAQDAGFGSVPQIAINARILTLIDESLLLKGNEDYQKESFRIRNRIKELSANHKKTKLRKLNEPLHLIKIEKSIGLIVKLVSQSFAKGYINVSQYSGEMNELEDTRVTIRAFLMLALTKKLVKSNALNAISQAMKTKDFIELNDFQRKAMFLSAINKIIETMNDKKSRSSENHDPFANFERTLKTKDHL